MSYRNKLLLRRTLIILLIAAALAALLMLIIYVYLGRYVIYTEDGAYFSFDPPEVAAATPYDPPKPASIELVTGEPVEPGTVLGDTDVELKDTEIHGVLLDYATLRDGSTLTKVELGADGSNTLVMEMKIADAEILTTNAVRQLLSRANNQDVWTVGILSCLADSEFVESNSSAGLNISGGARFLGKKQTYFLDPANDAAIAHVVEQILQLKDMGFDEVLLDDFYMPTSSDLDYNFGNRTAADVIAQAYEKVITAVDDQCRISILVTDPTEGHQLQSKAERLYVLFNDGSTAKAYADRVGQRFLVFVTDSHDTRFDEYGKVEASASYILDQAGTEEVGFNSDEEAAPFDDETAEGEEVGGENPYEDEFYGEGTEEEAYYEEEPEEYYGW